MSVQSKNIFTGGPDQAVTGAILRAPLGTVMPTSIADTIAPAFVDSGYIDEDGFKITPDRSLNEIKDWSLATLRRVLQEYNATVAWNHLETNGASLKNYLGDANVTVTAATPTAGTRLKGVFNGNEPDHYAWLMKIKDGPRRMLVAIADGQISKQNEIEFKKGEAIKWGIEQMTYPDSAGNYITLFTDDGVVTA